MTMLGKAARALCIRDGVDPDQDAGAGLSEMQARLCGFPAGWRKWNLYEGRVRDVLTAIREPDEAILAQVHDNDQIDHPDPRDENKRNIWQGIIDTILASDEGGKSYEGPSGG